MLLRSWPRGRADSESAFESRIADLQTQLAEQQSLIESRENEVTDLRSQINGLVAQVHDLERTNANALEQQRVAASRVEHGTSLAGH